MSNLGALASSSGVASAAAGVSLVPCWKRSGGEHPAPVRRSSHTADTEIGGVVPYRPQSCQEMTCAA